MTKKCVIYLQYTNPAGYPPLEHSSKILADQGWLVTFVGCGASGEADRFEFPPNSNIRVLIWRFPKPGWRQKLHFFFWTWWAVWLTFRTGAGWIYASEALACPAAWLASFLPGRKIVYHEHDSPAVHGISRFTKVLHNFRKRVCDKASAAILPNAERARIFKEGIRPKCPVQVVWNCPEKREIARDAKLRGEKYILFFHGSLNLARLPLAVLDALLLLPAFVELQFAGYTTSGAPRFIENFLQEAKNRGLESRVKYLGAPKLRRELLDLCRQADLGMAFMPFQSNDINMVAMTGASNKPFDYMACGLNLLVSDLPDWKMVFVDSGYGKACNPEDPKSIAETVEWYTGNPDAGRLEQRHGQERIDADWNYEHQFSPILQLMKS